MTQIIKYIPPVHEVLQSAPVNELLKDEGIPHLKMKEWIQIEIQLLREELLKDDSPFLKWNREDFSQKIIQELRKRATVYTPYRLQRVLNGTGTVLHTNLGRARLSDAAIDRVVETSKYYSSLEYNVSKGARGSRHDIIQDLLIKATGSEDAMVVNNNAAAVYLILRCLGKGKGVIVSRGELVEIGGSFRVSTIMEESDARLVEVGTTNKTHPYDYENALNENTSMLMKVHTSNFKTVGFTSEVTTEELKGIAATYSAQPDSMGQKVIVYEDLGSGSLYPFRHQGIGEEPVVKESLKFADIVSFSGDKLLGGPQAGIIAGKKKWIDELKKHPLARVLRVDKMTLAALEATLHSYVYREKGEEMDIPTIRDVMQTKEEIREKVDKFINVARDFSSEWEILVRENTSQVGGGTMPVVELPTVGITIIHNLLSTTSLEQAFRGLETPVITRILENKVYIDFRTIAEDEIHLLVEGLICIEKQSR